MWALDDESEGVKLDVRKTAIARFSQDSNLLAIGDDAGVIRLWFVEGASQVIELRGHKSGIRRLAFSEKGNRLYSMDETENVTEWKIEMESRTPQKISELVDNVLPYKAREGHVVPK